MDISGPHGTGVTAQSHFPALLRLSQPAETCGGEIRQTLTRKFLTETQSQSAGEFTLTYARRQPSGPYNIESIILGV